MYSVYFTYSLACTVCHVVQSGEGIISCVSLDYEFSVWPLALPLPVFTVVSHLRICHFLELVHHLNWVPSLRQDLSSSYLLFIFPLLLHAISCLGASGSRTPSPRWLFSTCWLYLCSLSLTIYLTCLPLNYTRDTWYCWFEILSFFPRLEQSHLWGFVLCPCVYMFSCCNVWYVSDVGCLWSIVVYLRQIWVMTACHCGAHAGWFMRRAW